MRYAVQEKLAEMNTRCLSRFIAFAGLLTAGVASAVRADDVDFRYVRPYGGRVMNLRPRDSFAFIGGQVYPVTVNSFSQPPAPNSWLNFRHPYTHAYVTVPVNLPAGMPKIERRSDRMIYDYGFVTVVIHFVRDGSVNVSYNSKTP
jgi:hypothetical protein